MTAPITAHRAGRVLITGSRAWQDPAVIHRALTDHAAPGSTIVHGACPTGADAMADALATDLRLTVERHPADWATHGKAAGPLRNQRMVDLGADVCLAFLLPGSRGTRDCVRRARAAGIRVVEHHA